MDYIVLWIFFDKDQFDSKYSTKVDMSLNNEPIQATFFLGSMS